LQAVGQTDRVACAVSAIVLSVLALSLGDAVIKSFSLTLPLWQVYVLRSLIVLPVLIAVVRLRGANVSLVPKSVPWTLCRSFLLALMWIAYYSSLPHIQLSVAAAAYYTSPLFIALFSAVFVGEKVLRKGWVAIVLGFAGVLVVLKPDAEDFNAYGLLPILAAALYAVAMVLTRTKCVYESPLVLSLVLNLAFIVVGTAATLGLAVLGLSATRGETNPFLFGPWIPLGLEEWLVLGALAAAIVIGSIGAAIAYQLAPSSIVATFDYSYLAFATLWGLLLFAEIPDMLTVLGMIMITSAGVLATRR